MKPHIHFMSLMILCTLVALVTALSSAAGAAERSGTHNHRIVVARSTSTRTAHQIKVTMLVEVIGNEN